MDRNKLVIVGAGGFGREVAWLAQSGATTAESIIFAVDAGYATTPEVARLAVNILSDELEGSTYVVAVGDPSGRRAVAEKCDRLGLVPTSLIHPRADYSRSVQISERGVIICQGTVLTVDIDIGEHVHINLNCTIGHDVSIGGFTTLSPGVHVSGNVRIGTGVFIGTGAVIINGRPGAPLTIGDGATIAAGACVTKHVAPGSLVAGVPAIAKR